MKFYRHRWICEAYSWTKEKTGKEGQGVQFIMIISKESKDGKKGYEIANQK